MHTDKCRWRGTRKFVKRNMSMITQKHQNETWIFSQTVQNSADNREPEHGVYATVCVKYVTKHRWSNGCIQRQIKYKTIPLKPIKRGFKVWVWSDSKTGYMYQYIYEKIRRWPNSNRTWWGHSDVASVMLPCFGASWSELWWIFSSSVPHRLADTHITYTRVLIVLRLICHFLASICQYLEQFA